MPSCLKSPSLSKKGSPTPKDWYTVDFSSKPLFLSSITRFSSTGVFCTECMKCIDTGIPGDAGIATSCSCSASTNRQGQRKNIISSKHIIININLNLLHCSSIMNKKAGASRHPLPFHLTKTICEDYSLKYFSAPAFI